jgi:hypothetical protein
MVLRMIEKVSLARSVLWLPAEDIELRRQNEHAAAAIKGV